MLWPVVGWVLVVVTTVDSVSPQILVVAQILVVVEVPVEWFQRVSILPPATLLVSLVVGVGALVAVMAFVHLVGFPIPESEITLITNEQKLFSLVSPFVPHTTTLLELPPIAAPNRELRPHMWR